MAMHQSRPKSMIECSGPECQGCASADCMAEGGEIRHPDHEEIERARKHQKSQEFNYEDAKKRDWDKVGAPMKKMADGGRVKGVQDPYNKWHITEPGSTGESGGVSIAGHSLRTGGEWGKEGAKEDHRRGIREIKEMGKRDRTNLAEGGHVYSGKQRSDNEQGVHPHDIGPHARTKTSSYAGNQVGWANRDNDPKQIENAKKEHGRVLGEMRSMKKPSLYADGGEVEDYDEEGEHELRHAMGGELMDALDRKDKKGIMDALEACVLSIKGRHE